MSEDSRSRALSREKFGSRHRQSDGDQGHFRSFMLRLGERCSDAFPTCFFTTWSKANASYSLVFTVGAIRTFGKGASPNLQSYAVRAEPRSTMPRLQHNACASKRGTREGQQLHLKESVAWSDKSLGVSEGRSSLRERCRRDQCHRGGREISVA